jgi:endonuclease-8
MTKVRDLDDATLAAVVRTVHRQMRRSVLGAATPRAAGPARSRFRVYDRARRPCVTCGTPIEARDIGTPARTVYWCPRCQGAI